ncbi:uncharacterized protein J7T54_004973 [Emericellopsis cladophorae]|uniref:C2H2-type domain-containing protein n=1 Tax=Emericellopsis cladophorae TaxID=2686198 RepID=A0A9Q0BDW6_9HYPO|nr:uncharacterized protein J7T54_004973 [Emericellopsis cladophorae]KAI6781807.1 hypothetical protein J7T54_004973 [Emericellopsis cladophorae]
MPGGPRNTRAKPSSESQEDRPKPSRGSSKTTTSDKKNGTKTADTARSTAPLATSRLNKQFQGKLHSNKAEIVETLMAVFEACLDQQLESYEGPCDGEGCSGHSSHGSSHRSCGKSTTDTSKQTRGKKRQLQRDDNSGGEDDNAEEGGRRTSKNKRIKAEPKKQRLLACPYRKYAPDRYKQEHVCCGPGFSKFHRLKEHVQRKHSLPLFHCRRCYEAFKSEAELDAHSRAATACTVRQLSPQPRKLEDGFDEEQLKLIKKRSTRNSPDHEKWVSLYCVLFNVSVQDVPSPYLDDDSPDWRNGHTGRSKHAPYLDYVRQEVTPRVRVVMEDAAGRIVQDAMPNAWKQTMAQFQPILRSVQRMWESNQSQHAVDPLTGLEYVHGVSGAVPESFAFSPWQDLSLIDFTSQDGFPFEDLDAPVQPQYSEALSDSSYPTDASGATGSSSATSNTSLEDQYLLQQIGKAGHATYDYTQTNPQGTRYGLQGDVAGYKY